MTVKTVPLTEVLAPELNTSEKAASVLIHAFLDSDYTASDIKASVAYVADIQNVAVANDETVDAEIAALMAADKADITEAAVQAAFERMIAAA